MSEERNANIRLEPDTLPGLRTLAWLLAAWLLMLGLVGWAWGIFSGTLAVLHPGGRPGPQQPAVAPATIAGVNQWLFREKDPRPDSREQARRRLESFGWVDRDAGTVHIPIEDAYDLELQEEPP